MEKRVLDEELYKDIAYFCSCYIDKCVVKVLNKIDYIVNNKTILFLLSELRKRGEMERKEFEQEIKREIEWGEGSKSFRNYCLTHASSYRDILYDMLIKGE